MMKMRIIDIKIKTLPPEKEKTKEIKIQDTKESNKVEEVKDTVTAEDD